MSKKKITDPEAEMEKLINQAKTLAQEPFDSNRHPDLPSLRSVAAELGTTVIRTRKLLITAGYFSSPTADAVQRLRRDGMSIDEIGEQLHLKPAAVYGYLPFTWNAYNLPQTTANSDRHKRYRACKKLKAALDFSDGVFNDKISYCLWHCVVIFQDYPFTTSGRGSMAGTLFSYTVSKESGKGGRHYSCSTIPGYGNEIFVVIDGKQKERSISRSTVDLAFQTYLEVKESEGGVSGPKQLGVFGASYLLPVFKRFVE